MAGRPKGFAPWRPQKRTAVLLADVEAVLEEYERYLPLTIRQVFYRLVGKGHPKTESFYATVQELCNRARRSRRIDFAAIRDDGVSRLGGETLSLCYETPQEYYETHDELYNCYARSWHADQITYVAVMCEASGMVPMLERVVRDYRVEVASSSGFDSLTAKHDLFRSALDRYEKFGQETVLLHLGDHDPSGVSVYESTAEDLEAFCEDSGVGGLIEMRRAALTPELIDELGIATTPDEVKPTDSRSRTFLERKLDPAAQLEAVPPDTIYLLGAFYGSPGLDMGALRASQEREQAERALVQAKLDDVNAVLREALDVGGGYSEEGTT